MESILKDVDEQARKHRAITQGGKVSLTSLCRTPEQDLQWERVVAKSRALAMEDIRKLEELGILKMPKDRSRRHKKDRCRGRA